MTEFSIFFHQNQLLKIRKFQDEVCNFLIQNGILCVPVFPIRIQCENLNEKSKIASITIKYDKFFDEIASPAARNDEETKILNLEAELEVDGKKTQGKIEFVQILENAGSSMRLLRCARNGEAKFARNGESKIDFSAISEIKKISPFKICEIEITKTEKSSQWKIFSEKWVKI